MAAEHPMDRPTGVRAGRARTQRWGMRRRHTGEGIEDDVNVSGFVLLGFGVVALALALIGAGYGAGVWAVVAGISCAVLLLAGTAVLAVEWRRRRSRSLSNPEERQGH